MSTDPVPTPVLAVTGLQIEARIAAGLGIETLAGAGDSVRLSHLLGCTLASRPYAVISFGLAGGIAAALQSGSIVVADAVSDGETCWRTDAGWRARLIAALPAAVEGKLFGSDRVLARSADKIALREAGAIAVDMESHISARLAAHHRYPFAALRVIADPAERSLPPSALLGVRSDGTLNILAVLMSLLRRPAECPALIRTTLDVVAALSALMRSRGQLDAMLSFVEAGTTSPGWSGEDREARLSQLTSQNRSLAGNTGTQR